MNNDPSSSTHVTIATLLYTPKDSLLPKVLILLEGKRGLASLQAVPRAFRAGIRPIVNKERQPSSLSDSPRGLVSEAYSVAAAPADRL